MDPLDSIWSPLGSPDINISVSIVVKRRSFNQLIRAKYSITLVVVSLSEIVLIVLLQSTQPHNEYLMEKSLVRVYVLEHESINVLTIYVSICICYLYKCIVYELNSIIEYLFSHRHQINSAKTLNPAWHFQCCVAIDLHKYPIINTFLLCYKMPPATLTR